MRSIERIECDHEYSEIVIHVDMSWGQKVRVLRCEYCGDTRLPAGFGALPHPVRQLLGLPAPQPATPRAPRIDDPSAIELAWDRLTEQHRELVDAALSARVQYAAASPAMRSLQVS
ncbi:MAG: hypothetical protein Q7S58_19895 [Candidatus Binatus sp.]|uniref:hypothetical protein n=1 Tax=Candidatus Binatus sp. TaxID=2811406 RepID=UPI00272347BD|nr:hypothetical protein [Candidatus Binatus sp.]MDO8434666.1 hypothetical protein [Candidatus Binatus sp.]